MDEISLRKLLKRDEGANLEFKLLWYALEDSNQQIAKASKGEMIKDILSLANGNTNVAGEDAYLVIGASDEKDDNGNRDLLDVVSEKPITRQRILNIVNPFCDPSIEDILCEYIVVDGKNLLVITILPSPHVHETTQKLKTKKITYDEYTVFVRHAEGVRTASTKERIALQDLKKLRYSETLNVPPITFGAFMGMLSFGLLGPKILTKEDDPKEKINSARLASASVGALLGGIIGTNYAQMRALPLSWKQATPRGKTIGTMAASAFGIAFWWLTSYRNRKRNNNKSK